MDCYLTSCADDNDLMPKCFIFNKAGREAAAPFLRQAYIRQMLERRLLDKFQAELQRFADVHQVPIIAALLVLDKPTSARSS